MSVSGPGDRGIENWYNTHHRNVKSCLDEVTSDSIKKASPKQRKALIVAANSAINFLTEYYTKQDSFLLPAYMKESTVQLRNKISIIKTNKKKSGILAKIGKMFQYMVGGYSATATQDELDALKTVVIKDLDPNRTPPPTGPASI